MFGPVAPLAAREPQAALAGARSWCRGQLADPISAARCRVLTRIKTPSCFVFDPKALAEQNLACQVPWSTRSR